jgi:hypothetical protein
MSFRGDGALAVSVPGGGSGAATLGLRRRRNEALMRRVFLPIVVEFAALAVAADCKSP